MQSAFAVAHFGHCCDLFTIDEENFCSIFLKLGEKLRVHIVGRAYGQLLVSEIEIYFSTKHGRERAIIKKNKQLMNIKHTIVNTVCFNFTGTCRRR